MRARDETTRPKNVGFRLTASDFDRLTEAASARQMSAGNYARHLVLDALDDRSYERLSAEILAVAKRVIHLKRGLAALALVTLTQPAKVDEQAARKWVHDEILGRDTE